MKGRRWRSGTWLKTERIISNSQGFGDMAKVGWLKFRGHRAIPDDILDHYDHFRYPVKVFAVAQDLGVEVYKNTEWEPERRGEVRYSGLGAPRIVVNANISNIARRYTVAHELGHVLLDLQPGYRAEVPPDFAGFRGGAIEDRANRFARRLLVPDDLLDFAGQRYGWNEEMLAYGFQVSNTLMKTRVEEYLHDD